MKIVRFILLILLLMIPMGVKGAEAQTTACYYTYSFVYDDNITPRGVSSVDMHRKYDGNYLVELTFNNYYNGLKGESTDYSSGSVEIKLWKDAVLMPKSEYIAEYNNPFSPYIDGWYRPKQYTWAAFVTKYIGYDKNGDKYIFNGGNQKCLPQIYAIFKFPVVENQDTIGFRFSTNNEDDIGRTKIKLPIKAELLSSNAQISCNYRGSLAFDNKQTYGYFFENVILNFDKKILTPKAGNNYKDSIWTSSYYLSTVQLIKAKTLNPFGSKAEKENATEKNVYMYNTTTSFYACPNTILTEPSNGSVRVRVEKSCQVGNRNCLSLSSIEINGDPGSYTPKPHPYDNVEVCDDKTYSYIRGCGCMPASLTDLTSRMYLLLKIAAPALLLIIGGFEMVKAMTAADESAIKKAQQKLIKKVVAAAAVFVLLTAIQLLASVLGADTDAMQCLDYLLNGYNV